MKVSVITVCLNSTETIESTIQSVLRQNYKHVEYVVVDGGSNDGKLEILEKYNWQQEGAKLLKLYEMFHQKKQILTLK